MGLKNAFEEIATERTARLILAATNYARDINDRMRVVVDSGSITVNQQYMNGSSTAGTYRVWNDVNAIFTMDPREVQRQASLINGEIARQKWSYS
jgi:hypothetical protein